MGVMVAGGLGEAVIAGETDFIACNVGGIDCDCSGVARVWQPLARHVMIKIMRTGFHFISLPLTNRYLPKGLRYAPSGYWWAGRDNIALTEPTSSRATCLKTRRLPPFHLPWGSARVIAVIVWDVLLAGFLQYSTCC